MEKATCLLQAAAPTPLVTALLRCRPSQRMAERYLPASTPPKCVRSGEQASADLVTTATDSTLALEAWLNASGTSQLPRSRNPRPLPRASTANKMDTWSLMRLTTQPQARGKLLPVQAQHEPLLPGRGKFQPLPTLSTFPRPHSKRLEQIPFRAFTLWTVEPLGRGQCPSPCLGRTSRSLTSPPSVRISWQPQSAYSSSCCPSVWGGQRGSFLILLDVLSLR